MTKQELCGTLAVPKATGKPPQKKKIQMMRFPRKDFSRSRAFSVIFFQFAQEIDIWKRRFLEVC